jgi:gliding motility-associated-like protein
MLKKLLPLLLLFFGAHMYSQSFTSIWNTANTSPGSSGANEITIPTNPAYTTYNYTVDWGDGSTDTGVTGNITHTYAAPGSYTLMIDGNFPSIYFNNTNDRLKIIEILGWGTIQWQTMEDAFHGCENINFDAIDAPDLSQTTSLRNMFRDCSSFNGIVNNWDVSTITNMSGLFRGARIFNRPLDTWNTAAVTDMSETFYSAQAFNEPLDNWNTATVTNMSGMFQGTGAFNQNINNWNVGQVTDMSSTFHNANRFNFPLNNWNVGNVTTMSHMFDNSGFNLPIANWDVSNVTDMSGMFSQAQFNQPIGNWDMSSVTDISSMFQRNRTFNQPLNSWDVSNVTKMVSVFDGYYWDQVYNQPLDNWDVGSVTDMSYMFRDNSAFNQDINGWNVSSVTNMQGMFSETPVFNQNLSSWNVGNVTNMSGMFQQAQVFNQPLNSWNVSTVTNVSGMFNRASGFNQPLNSWTLNNVTSFQSLFDQATSFNQDISAWDTSSITNMSGMFNQASSFDQDLGSWDIAAVTNMTNMLSNSGISQENYDDILIGWSGQNVNSGITLGAIGLQYCDAITQRQSLMDDDGWNITGDAVNCSYVICTQITMPHASDTATPANSDIRWDPAPNATGYRITLEVDRGGPRSYVNINGVPANNYDVGNVVGLNFSNEFTAGDTVYVTVVPYNNDGPATGCPEISFTVVESWVNSPDAFKLTYDTRIQEGTDTTPINQLRIQTESSLTYDYNIDWGDGQYDNNVTGNITHTYLIPGIYTVSIIGTFPSPRHDQSNSDAFKLLSIDQWGTQVWESMYNAFSGCENMEYNATDIPNLTNVENMSSMFIVCRKFNGNINNWDVSNVTNMYGMFGVASIFNQPLDNWDVGKVTNMNFMFAGTDEFNQNIDRWDVGSVTNFSRMFRRAEVFNQPLNSWDVSSATDMSQMFEYTPAFNQPLNNWNVSSVTDMSDMFYYAEVFNQNLNSWDVGNVQNMSGMFSRATVFDQPLNSWDVSSVTDMSTMFSSAAAFDQPLSNWNVSTVSTMQSMFSSASAFNQNIDAWNVTNVIAMQYMFNYATSFDRPLNNWNVNSVVNMSSMFRGAQVFNQPLNNWDVSAVANMSNMFEDAVAFNQPINTWDVSSVTLMESMFEDAALYNQPMNNWNVGVVTNFEAMFKNALVFNEPLTSWNTGEALTMKEMFMGAAAFDQPLDPWNTSFVTTMESMFENAIAFNQPLGSWNVASVTTMEKMFKFATAFNGSIDAWNVRGVDTMREMFSGATAFNQSINNWRVSGVSNMDYFFNQASAYNQAMDLWNLGNVSMRSAFQNATALNQYLGDWDVSGVNDMRDMLDNTALTRENYDDTLISWSEQNLTSGISLGAQGLPYCDAVEERQSMIDNFGWNITDDIRDCPIPACTQLTSPLNGAVDVPVNTNITWEHAQYARGYRLTVGTTAGGNDIVNNVTINNDTSYEFASNFNTGDTVFVTLIPFNDEGDAVGPCTEESFTLSNNPATIPDCTNLTEPLNNAIDVLVTTDLSWNPISNADGYRITAGTTTGGNDILDNQNVGNVTTFDLTTDLPEDTDIFITIVPYNDEGDATTCTEEHFKTELIPVPPVCTTLTSPANGATDIASDTNLGWTAVSNASGYLVMVGTTSGGIEIVNNVNVGNVTTYDIPTDLQEGRTHYVTIIPYNDEGDAIGCSEETFTTGNSTSPPSCAVLSAPVNGSTNVALDANLNWIGSGSADGYRLSVGTTSGGAQIFSGNLGSVTTYDPVADFPASTRIYVTITAYNANGDATGCTEESFVTDGPPACTALSTPTNGATNVPVDTDITWNASTDADGYKLTVTASNSTINNLTDFDITSGNTYDFPNDFEQGETVTVTLVPYNSVGDAIGCTSESFTIRPLPACTNLVTPANGAVDVALDTAIEWTPSTAANGYRLSVSANNSTANNLTDFDVRSGTNYDFLNDFEQGETVTVTIVPYNELGDAIGCSSESFTIKTVPGCTNLTSPRDGDVVAATNGITWNTIADADGYKLTISGSNSTSNDITDLNVTDTTYAFLNDFDQGEVVTVTITPYNEIGDAIGCASESFTIRPLPSCTNLISPFNGATEVAVTTDIEWIAAAHADGYRISVGTSFNSTDIVNDEDVLSLTNYTFAENLPSETIIYVTVVPYNTSGDAVGCISESFVTEVIIPECAVLSSPVNGETDVSLESAISWEEVENTNGYRLSIGTTLGGTDILDNQDMRSSITYYHGTEFPIGTEIFVTIVPYNAKGDAVQCEAQSFTTRVPDDDTKYGFSPDGDGINEYWHIDNIEYHPENTVTIYNRWGDAVFKTENYDNASKVFRGDANLMTKMGAGRLPAGTYFFHIQIEGETILNKTKGYVIIKR